MRKGTAMEMSEIARSRPNLSPTPSLTLNHPSPHIIHPPPYLLSPTSSPSPLSVAPLSPTPLSPNPSSRGACSVA